MRHIVVSKRHVHGNPSSRGPSQKWKVIYQDELEPPLKKGDMHKGFGFRLDTDFYVISAMASRRFLDLNSLVLPMIKTRVEKRYQTWFFCSKTKTI